MFNHVMIGSNDIERSRYFYDAVLGTVGVGEPVRNTAASGHKRLFYRHNGNSFCVTEPINGEIAACANGGTIAFKCSSPENVREFHGTAVAHGGASIENSLYGRCCRMRISESGSISTATRRARGKPIGKPARTRRSAPV